MTHATQTTEGQDLFEDLRSVPRAASGVFPNQMIRNLIDLGAIAASKDIVSEQIQPASLDLRLGDVAYHVRASFLPNRAATVKEKLDIHGLDRLDLTEPKVLHGGVYIIPLQERLALPGDVRAKANPKSTTGRLDIFTRLITDNAVEFETVPKGYRGPLYVEVAPRTFPIKIRSGMRLNQIRFLTGDEWLDAQALALLDRKERLVWQEGHPIDPMLTTDGGLAISVNLRGAQGEVVAYKARQSAPVVNLDEVGSHDIEEFWEARECRDQRLILDASDFYILASKEHVRVPPTFAAELLPFDASIGEYRVHYAGFFDPGFGYGDDGEVRGTPAVLEVRAHDIPFVLEHGQTVGKLRYSYLHERPKKIYGTVIGSSYQGQGLALSRQFKNCS